MRGAVRYPYRHTARTRLIKPDSELILQKQVCQYMRMQYPHIIFRSDYAAGLALSMRQATIQKSMQAGRAYPDLFIAYPNVVTFADGTSRQFAGLFIELKREGTTIYKKIGEGKGQLVASEHIKEQAAVLSDLNRVGYMARFAVGFDNARRLIDGYIGIKQALPLDEAAF